MRPSPKLLRVTELAAAYKQRVPDATVEEMVLDPTIMAAIEAVEPERARAFARAKEILRAAIILDVGADGRPIYVSVLQETLIEDDPETPPIAVLEASYRPRTIAALTPNAATAALVRRTLKSIKTRLRNAYWMTPALYTEVVQVLDRVESQLTA